MQELKFGSKVKSISILRSTVAENVKGRAIILTPNPRVKQVAWDPRVKRAIEVDQDAVIKYRLSSRPMYYFLVARLNTDMKGNVIGDDFIIEYLALPDSVYSEFTDACDDQAIKPYAVVLRKQAKGQFQYMKVTPANVEISDVLRNKIEALKNTEGVIDSMWKIVDLSTSISVKEYEEILKSNPDLENTPIKETHAQKYVSTVSAPAAPALKESPKAETSKESPKAESDSDEFGSGDEFNSI